MSAKLVFIMEIAQLLVSIEFAFALYFLWIRNEKLPAEEKRFRVFVYVIATYIIIRIITLFAYAWIGSSYISVCDCSF